MFWVQQHHAVEDCCSPIGLSYWWVQLFCQSVNRNHAEPHHISHSLTQTASQPSNQSLDQPGTKATSQPAKTLANQAVRQLLSQTGSHSASNTTSQVVKATKSTQQCESQVCLWNQSASVTASQSSLTWPKPWRKQAVRNLYSINTMWHLAPGWERFIAHILGS